jgi:hypothetical protein
VLVWSKDTDVPIVRADVARRALSALIVLLSVASKAAVSVMVLVLVASRAAVEVIVLLLVASKAAVTLEIVRVLVVGVGPYPGVTTDAPVAPSVALDER